MKKTPMVLVKWIDAAHEFGWIDGDGSEGNELTHVYSLGFLLYQDKKLLKLALSVAPDQHAQTLTIPANMVQSVHRIKHKALK